MRALFVTVSMKPEYRDQILKGALEDGRGSREDEPGCLRFDVVQDDSDPNTIYFYEVYRDDAALEAHRAAPHYPAWGNLPADWFVADLVTFKGHDFNHVASPIVTNVRRPHDRLSPPRLQLTIRAARGNVEGYPLTDFHWS
jgi:autoinducer 2-degrading protein